MSKRLISQNVEAIFATARNFASQLGVSYIGSEHLMLGILAQKKNTACRILKVLGVEPEDVKHRIESKIETKDTGSSGSNFSARATRIIGIAFSIVQCLDMPFIGSEHILMGILKEGSGIAAQTLVKEYRLTYDVVIEELYGTRKIVIKDFTLNQKKAEKALKKLEEKLQVEELHEELFDSKISEIVHLFEYIEDQLGLLNQEALIKECRQIRKKVQEISRQEAFLKTEKKLPELQNTLGLEETVEKQQAQAAREYGMRVGQGYDVHRLVPGRKLILGGVEIEFDKGLLGHSDADVLTHAVMDSLLGALGKRDIGYHFPDNDPRYKDVSSLKLLEHVAGILKGEKFGVANIDAVIMAQKPKLAGFLPAMESNIAGILGVNSINVNIKATTTERLGFEGRTEGMVAQCVCLLYKFN
ncbi:MAG: 2-C-methyl-D-erythritol 2,4-cyclodiphosphate synthase [Vulcanimicrobiota bacterium]